jgi:Zn-dependent protease with chaperone function
MFVLRGLMVGLAFFGVCYCTLSLMLAILWSAARFLWCTSVFSSARSLFALRVFPLAMSALVTLVFAMPAFFLLEGAKDEDLGTLIFSLGTLLLLGAGLIRVVAAQVGTSRLLADWLGESEILNSSLLIPTFVAKRSSPPLILYGICEPRIVVSETAAAVLSPKELAAAIRHEASHLRFRDNLKKFILHTIPFPGLGTLDRAWQEAAEFAADEAAVSNRDEALNLAAALIKLCRFAPVQKPPALTAGLVELTALVNVRVHRLLDWNTAKFHHRKLRWLWLPLVLVAFGSGIVTYSHALLLTHRLTEWFIH